MATAIKAIPTLKGKEAREFLHRAEEAEHNYQDTGNRDNHAFCLMAHAILSKAGMLSALKKGKEPIHGCI